MCFSIYSPEQIYNKNASHEEKIASQKHNTQHSKKDYFNSRYCHSEANRVSMVE